MTAEQGPLAPGMIHRLIGSDIARGAVVYNSAGDRIGRIERLMVDKATGRVVSAILAVSEPG